MHIYVESRALKKHGALIAAPRVASIFSQIKSLRWPNVSDVSDVLRERFVSLIAVDGDQRKWNMRDLCLDAVQHQGVYEGASLPP